MANYITNIQADNSPATVGTGSFSTAGPSNVLQMTPSLIQLVDPLLGYAEYYGSFSYTYSGMYQYLSWPGSTLTGISTFNLGWGLLDSISGLNVPGAVYESYALNNDVTGLVAYFFSGNDTITGSSYNDVLWGYAGDDTIDGGMGADTLAGGVGNDVYVVDNTADTVTENANEGTDAVQSSASFVLGANVENLTLTGSGNIDATGNASANMLTGNGGSNLLDGFGGADTLSGGLGNDTYVVDDAGDLITENAGAGIDLVQSSISHTLGANLENLTLTGAAAITGTGNELDNVIVGNSGGNYLDGGLGIDSYAGGAGNDTYVVDTALPATALNITGQAGNWVSGGGNYTITADSGNWMVNQIFDMTGDGVVDYLGFYFLSPTHSFNLSFGTNQLGTNLAAGTYLNAERAPFASPGSPGLDFSMDGRGNNQVFGNFTIQSIDIDYSGVSPVLLSMSATFSESGSLTEPPLFGELRYNIPPSSLGEQITELPNEGVDTVLSSVSYALTANLEHLTLTGATVIDGTGNELDNGLIGNAAANTLTGNAGNDTLDGGLGADTMVGGLGDDIYMVDDAGDVVTELAGQGTDTVQSSLTYTLGANVEHLTLTGTGNINATGNSVDNTLIGNAGNNTLYGGGGNDTMSGGAGNDTYNVNATGDTIIENAGEGTDLVNSSVSYTLSANVDNLTLTGTAANNATGNDIDNILTGNTGNNILTGGLGNDTLNGGTGVDSLVGGTGNDTYVVDNTGDVVTELAGEGNDTVQASVAWTLGANLENLTILSGSGAINATGNSLNNILIGNASNNTLYGGGGNDTMSGGAGGDIYNVNAAGDLVIENAGEGIDTVNSSISHTLNANVEDLALTGTSAIDGTGNELNNKLTGNSGANILSGGLGNDKLIGGAGTDTLYGGVGNDTYVVDSLADTIVEYGGEGTDTVQSSVSYTLGADLEYLILTGASAVNATGNGLNNTLLGNAAANVMDGGLGNDTLNGGLGNDTYLFGRGYGTDKVVDVDATVGNTDIASFAMDVNYDQVWFQHVGSSLYAKIIGTSDTLVINGWYNGAASQVEQFQAGGRTLSNTNVETLVQAMAAFAPPAAGQTTFASLPADQQTTLAPVIAANWV